jgi:hypothetical protein
MKCWTIIKPWPFRGWAHDSPTCCGCDRDIEIIIHVLWKKITFGALSFLGRALRNYKNTFVRYLSHGHPLKYLIGFYFYITHFFYIRDLSRRKVFWSFCRAREQPIKWKSNSLTQLKSMLFFFWPKRCYPTHYPVSRVSCYYI